MPLPHPNAPLRDRVAYLVADTKRKAAFYRLVEQGGPGELPTASDQVSDEGTNKLLGNLDVTLEPFVRGEQADWEPHTTHGIPLFAKEIDGWVSKLSPVKQKAYETAVLSWYRAAYPFPQAEPDWWGIPT